ncbi:uncharacterized protein LOC117150862 isoform X2 [Drosophila mauritiana]|uniref:Uncharacterized protein LOC117150862 isoform X2 n=1 Tax=Drosophila mauritiana TaxID=7226 RepID=A0A6P8LI79_DROMA|nr:uncharacterized protein LOC117150862 isoform X2 [Drosophila mauritiana]
MPNLKNVKNRSKFYDQQDKKRTHRRRKKVAARLDAKPIQDEPVTSSGEGLYPQMSRMMTHPNEPSNQHPPRMDSRQIPPWQASPAAYLGYHFRFGR